MGLGVPMVLILLPVAWWVLIRCYPPEVETIGAAEEIFAERAALGPLSAAEIKVIAILSTMMALWVAGSWVPWLDVSLVALLGAIVVFLPGVGLIDWPTAQRAIGWDTLLMIGGVTTLGKASMDTGLAKWFVVSCLSGVQDWDPLWLVAAVSAFTVVVHLPLPIAPVVNAVLIPPVAELALDPQTGQMLMNPALLALPVAFTASCAMLLPLDAVPLLTYSKGYYRMGDMLLPGSIISLVWVIVMTLLMVYWAPALGLVGAAG
jgi:sodium-dependent dicarboxylate transporter 2/3/5